MGPEVMGAGVLFSVERNGRADGSIVCCFV